MTEAAKVAPRNGPTQPAPDKLAEAAGTLLAMQDIAASPLELRSTSRAWQRLNPDGAASVPGGSAPGQPAPGRPTPGRPAPQNPSSGDSA